MGRGAWDLQGEDTIFGGMELQVNLGPGLPGLLLMSCMALDHSLNFSDLQFSTKWDKYWPANQFTSLLLISRADKRSPCLVRAGPFRMSADVCRGHSQVAWTIRGEKQPPATSQRDHEKVGQEPRLPGRPHLVKCEAAELNWLQNVWR